MNRCCYKHFFLTYDHHKSDGSEQCWLAGGDVANYGTKDDPNYFCMFHAPIGEKPIDRTGWDGLELQTKQATRLVELIEEWKEETKSEQDHTAFSLPGLTCGQIDFSNIEFPGNLWLGKANFLSHANFKDCRFRGQAGFRGATFHAGVDFSGSTFIDRPIFLKATFLAPAVFKHIDFKNNVEFMEVVFCEGVDFHKSNFYKNVDFSGALFKKQANLNRVTFNKKFVLQKIVSDGNFNISGLLCHNGLAIEDCSFLGHVTLNKAEIDGIMRISQCLFADRLSINTTHFKNRVTFSNNIVKNKVTCTNSTFDDKTTFNNHCFNGQVDFVASIFQKEANFTNCVFRQNANFTKTKFNGATFFKDTTFVNPVDFQQVIFSDLDMVNANFNSNVTFKKSIFNGLANLNSLSVRGNSDFSYIEVKGKLLLNGVLVNRLWLLGCTFNTSVIFNGCSIGTLRYEAHKGERVAFNRCRIEYPQKFLTENDPSVLKDTNKIKWSFSNQDCSGLAFLNMSLKGTDFLGADIVDTRFISCGWEQGDQYSKVSRHNDICSKGNYEKLYLLFSLYQQLKKNLENARDYQSSGDFHYREMELRAKLLKDKKGRKSEKVILWLYATISDYGENYIKITKWFCLSFVIATLLLSTIEIFKSIGFTPCSTDYWRSYFNCFSTRIPEDFKLIMFGIIPSGFSKAVLAKDVFDLSVLSRSVLVIQGIVAVIFITLFVMAIRRRFKR